MKKRLTLLAFALYLLFPLVALSQPGKISGYMFGDYYYVANNHVSELEGKNGFWFRRIYLTYDQDLSETFSIRFRLELNSPGDFTTSSKLEPFLKDGYLRWSKSQHSILLGLSPTPTWDHLEKIWGYRSVIKTPGDLYKFGSSRDFGLTFKGALDQKKRVHYHFMFANGNSTRSETNEGKKLLLALRYQFTSRFSFEVYGDWEDRDGPTNRYTGQFFLGYRGRQFRLGVQWMHQTRERNVDDLQLQVLSLFGVSKLHEKVWGFVRFDRTFDAIPDGPSVSFLPLDGTSKINFLLLGLDFRPHEQVQLMPNVELVFYDSFEGRTPSLDMIPRLTFFYVWK
ncbi:hypothetical protein MJD09_22800 [bacterium]|nr:hypothetical protein [bacterium]